MQKPQRKPIKPQPQYFGDKDQLRLQFEPSLSYTQNGKIYLAYSWYWDGETELVGGEGDRDVIVIEIPWEIKVKGEWKRLFENDEPFVDVEVWNEYKDQVGSPEISMELKPKFIGNYEFSFAKIEIPVGDEIPDGIVYVGIIPKPKYTGMELTTLELYYHTWDYQKIPEAAVSIGATLFFPETASEDLFGVAESTTISGGVSWVLSKLLGNHLKGGWEKHKALEVEISYDAYPEKSSPGGPSCFKNICPTKIKGERP